MSGGEGNEHIDQRTEIRFRNYSDISQHIIGFSKIRIHNSLSYKQSPEISSPALEVFGSQIKFQFTSPPSPGTCNLMVQEVGWIKG